MNESDKNGNHFIIIDRLKSLFIENQGGYSAMHDLIHGIPSPLEKGFFDRDAREVAQSLLGKMLGVHNGIEWLMARVIETEAYFEDDKASHSSLGYTEKRKALFMPAGTIYMYYARGGDSLNFSCQGAGNAVLIKSAIPVAKNAKTQGSVKTMQQNNPHKNGSFRAVERLCSGQTLLCRSLGLKVPEWDRKQLEAGKFEVWGDAYKPEKIIQTRRLGIRPDRDAQLPYRYIDFRFAPFCTKNPLRVRNFRMGEDYTILKP